MGVLRSGILGHMSGKTAGVVGGKWKDKSYIREYVIPANPNTTPQQTQRAKMTMSVLWFKPLVGQIFNKYVDKFQKSMSGFNAIVSQNIAIMTPTPGYSSIIITLGKLWIPTVTGRSQAGGVVTMTWDPASLGNNGAATDKVYACTHNLQSGLWGFAAAEVLRSAGTINVPIAGVAGNTLHSFVFAAKYSLTSPTLLEMVSNSDYDVTAWLT
jgi:hypothetical protein